MKKHESVSINMQKSNSRHLYQNKYQNNVSNLGTKKCVANDINTIE